MDYIELSKELYDELESYAKSKRINIDKYIMFLVEEEILKEVTISLVSDSSIY